MKITCPNCRRYLGELVAGQWLTVHGEVEQITNLPVRIRCRCRLNVSICEAQLVRYNVTVQGADPEQEPHNDGLRAASVPMALTRE